LGTGTLACYARPGQHWRFYEIDPAVVAIARAPAKFSYLARCLPDPVIRLGDARLALMEEPSASLDLLALDAFSSDAVPMHLLTREAFATYARVVQPGGLLLVHISNRFLDLDPVVAAAARDGGWHAVELDYTPSRREPNATASWWVAMSRDPRPIAALEAHDARWRPVVPRAGFVSWTDDYSSILPLLRAFH
jgi:spermidine synthase